MGEWTHIYTSQTSRPQQDKYTLTNNSQFTRRFYPNSALPITAKEDTRIGNHAMGQQGISENRKDAYGLTIAPRKRLGSISPIPFCRMHRIGIGGQGFRDIGGSRSCPDAGTRQMPTLASGILPVAIVGLVRGRHCWHRRTGIPELLSNRGTGRRSVTRRRSRRSGYRVGLGVAYGLPQNSHPGRSDLGTRSHDDRPCPGCPELIGDPEPRSWLFCGGYVLPYSSQSDTLTSE